MLLDAFDNWNWWAWCKANPAVAWPIVTAIVTVVLKPRSPAAYAAMSAIRPRWFFSRFAALLQLIGALGLDPIKALQVIGKVFTGKQDSGAKVIAVIFFAFGISACSPNTTPATAKSLSYGIELEECNRLSKTCIDSIQCENEVRTRYKRPLRDVSAGCK